ncbi:Ku protein [Mesorhizobium caraganae]|uniref:Ku protein n=1 Tax=Mesorhizobium caraganae TaxID=483206 RepID=UPI003337F7A5
MELTSTTGSLPTLMGCQKMHRGKEKSLARPTAFRCRTSTVRQTLAGGTIRIEMRCHSWKRDKQNGRAACCLEGLLQGWFGYLRREDCRRHQRSIPIHFKILNRKDGLPVKSGYADEETGKPVDAADQVKGFEMEKDEFLQIEPDDIKALKLTSKHTLEVGEFVSIDDIDTRYLGSPTI